MTAQQSLFSPGTDEKSGEYSFDLETKKTFHELEGQRDASELGVSVGVLREESTGDFNVFREDEVNALIDKLFTAEKVIGFNLLGFDYKVLEPYTPMDFGDIPTVDMMKDLQDSLDKRVKLDDVAEATLDVGKSADGVQAVTWYKRGEIDRIIEYCKQDVKITSEVFRYGTEHGHVKIPSMDQTREIPVEWTVRKGELE